MALTQRQHPFSPPLPPFRCLLQIGRLQSHSTDSLFSMTQPLHARSPGFQNLSVLLVRPKHFTSDSCLNDKPIALGFQTRLGWLLHKPLLLSLCLLGLQPNPSLCPHCQLQIPLSVREEVARIFFFFNKAINCLPSHRYTLKYKEGSKANLLLSSSPLLQTMKGLAWLLIRPSEWDGVFALHGHVPTICRRTLPLR